ncbi:ABC-2 type transport system ATP-binding protein [Aequitasia blattaphilus]|uniref:ABC transporter ATP-binding protein n=1 Tax=Aequitasia blattaphilus TaxID=2949332 RepID=A0ABT1ECV1_9FIRM|nr:ABC transporter ATP-binding protein [Aequitasia blattaphilus]MCP1103647.1 ABC transporter ATP-binding protein [Aequitasia blattaphilus]MCR8616287.1 ABC transporter ATP-binding protein [Aequitasia blattaphilus]
MLTINQLQVSYGNQIALNIQKSLHFKKGDRIGIIGANGAGKSTLLKACLGLIPYSGSIDTKIKTSDMAIHMQENSYTENMAIKHVLEAILGTKIKTNTKLQKLIEYFEFSPSLNKKFKALSGGQKQRLTLIMVLMQEAPITFFDEVTTGLDFETRSHLMEKILNWYQNQDSTICLVTHYYTELNQLANKILILEAGEVIDFDTKEALFHRYCGYCVILVEKTAKAQKFLSNFQQISGPPDKLTIQCNTMEEEKEILLILLSHKLNYSRTDNDIEIMSLNAIEHFKKEHTNHEKISA